MKKPLISTLIIAVLMMLPFSSAFATSVVEDDQAKTEAMQVPEESQATVEQNQEEPAADDSAKVQKDDDM
tara:strand:+ start:568 stop:777 length:210 start_codon:yes stop_codon:yes gene_type:complete